MSNLPPGAGALIGKRLGSYDLVALLALGGTAEIYLARTMGTAGFEKYVVVKCLHDHLAEDEDFVKMFIDEARLAANLNHSNIAQTMELGQYGNRYYMVMEYLAGLSLAMMARRGGERSRNGVMPLGITLNVMHQACAGLHYAHEAKNNGAPLNIVHRDISPQNLVITFEGVVKVVDFGIAKAEQRETQTKAGTIKGKFAYMSPEQCVAQGVDRRTDVFALGVILHELLTGRRLFKRPNPYDTYQAVIDCKVLAPSKLNHDLDKEIDQITLRALSKDKAQRFPSAEAMGEALLGYMYKHGMRGGPAEISRFFDENFTTELREHGERMRELISGESTGSGVWDGERPESFAEPLRAQSNAVAQSTTGNAGRAASAPATPAARPATPAPAQAPAAARPATPAPVRPSTPPAVAPPGHARTAAPTAPLTPAAAAAARAATTPLANPGGSGIPGIASGGARPAIPSVAKPGAGLAQAQGQSHGTNVPAAARSGGAGGAGGAPAGPASRPAAPSEPSAQSELSAFVKDLPPARANSEVDDAWASDDSDEDELPGEKTRIEMPGSADELPGESTRIEANPDFASLRDPVPMPGSQAKPTATAPPPVASAAPRSPSNAVAQAPGNRAASAPANVPLAAQAAQARQQSAPVNRDAAARFPDVAHLQTEESDVGMAARRRDQGPAATAPTLLGMERSAVAAHVQAYASGANANVSGGGHNAPGGILPPPPAVPPSAHSSNEPQPPAARLGSAAGPGAVGGQGHAAGWAQGTGPSSGAAPAAVDVSPYGASPYGAPPQGNSDNGAFGQFGPPGQMASWGNADNPNAAASSSSPPPGYPQPYGYGPGNGQPQGVPQPGYYDPSQGNPAYGYAQHQGQYDPNQGQYDPSQGPAPGYYDPQQGGYGYDPNQAPPGYYDPNQSYPSAQGLATSGPGSYLGPANAGESYAQSGWAQAPVRRAVPTWLLALMFVVSVAVALAVTVAIRKLMHS